MSAPLKLAKRLAAACVLLLLCILVLLIFGRPGTAPILATASLADGRIFQVEAVTYGTRHRAGSIGSALFERFRPWLPGGVRKFFEPKYPRSEINLEEPALVVWVNAIDPNTGLHVDCQGIRVEFVDGNGELFAEVTPHWFGYGNFWRVGHVFRVYPRAERRLKLQITAWRTNVTARLQFQNPHVARPAAWSGGALPRQKRVENLDVVLTQLMMRTNRASYHETPTRYWEPLWELHRNGTAVSGWDDPEWTAEDPTGNRGQHLGVHQPVLRFSATFYPSATNLQAAVLLATLPEIALVSLNSNVWWNSTVRLKANEIIALGVFPVGTHVFLEGQYQTNPAVRMGAVRGGAPSGWTAQSERLDPVRLRWWHGHYTYAPVVYVRAPEFKLDRIALRLRDEQGRYWIAEPEPQGVRDGIHPFLIELPPEAKCVVPELVVLEPVQAEFFVNTADSTNP